MTFIAAAAAVAASALAGLRWLRVAQREHYLPGAVTRFALRWWTGIAPNRVLGLAVVLGAALAETAPLAGVIASGALALGPFGLAVRGRTARLVWTRRLTRLAGATGGVYLALVLVAAVAGMGATVAIAAGALAPVLIDVALVALAPVERRLVEPFVRTAAIRLKQADPTVVAITGSYGKTSTKGYVAHLVAGTKTVVPTPASFNNRAGLARAVNEHLAPGTEVFVAEMGTYGRGEIAELCSWIRPDIAVITAIGPVHLERMGSERVIAEAKAEILEGAKVAVLNVDHPLLARLAERRAYRQQRVVRCSARSREADVAVVDEEVLVGGVHLTKLDRPDVPPTNAACAVAVALELGVPREVVAERLAGLPVAPHRVEVGRAASGAAIIDDTYNANPAGTAVALAALARHAEPEGRRVVVTPGLVELGPRQREDNVRLAEAVADAATHLIVVGHTNRRALLEGAQTGSAEVIVVETREEAVEWVREHLREGDVVLYENDLPDHYP